MIAHLIIEQHGNVSLQMQSNFYPAFMEVECFNLLQKSFHCAGLLQDNHGKKIS